MLWAASLGLTSIYLLLPVASLLIAWRLRLAGRRFVTGAWLGGMLLGVAILAAYSVGLGGRVPAWQAALTLYLAVGLLLWLKCLDAGLTFLLRKLLRAGAGHRARLAVVGVTRLLLFGAFALPWVMAAVMVYRPKIVADEPFTVAMIPGERVSFPSADGTSVAGHYFQPVGPGRTTALLCHGLGGDARGFARLIERLVQNGVAVLAVDLRAHGRSGGQLSTFGVREKFDAIGAIDWIESTHPDNAERIVGIGASVGAAALLGAATMDERLDSIIVLSTYATLKDEVDFVGRHRLVPPIGWLVQKFGLTLASLHVGVNLSAVRPVDDIAKIWPRPVLVVHGTADEIIPFEQGRRLYNAAPIGRSSFWVYGGTHNGIVDDAAVIDRVVEFIQSAEPVPVV